MLKKAIVLILVLALCGSICACESDQQSAPQVNTEEQNPTTAATTAAQETEENPEEITADFVQAMYYGDLDRFFAHIPEFTYDIFIAMEGLEVADGVDKADVVYEYFANIMEEEPEDIAADVQVETKISETMTKETYIDVVREHYIPEGVVSEETMEQLEDAVFVAFNCDVTYENGEKFSMTDFESALPCVKIGGKWYVDMLYLVMVPVQVEKSETMVAVPN